MFSPQPDFNHPDGHSFWRVHRIYAGAFMTTRKYGECSFIRLVADVPGVALADQYSKTPQTFDHACRMISKGARESDFFSWSAGVMCMKNIFLFGEPK